MNGMNGMDTLLELIFTAGAGLVLVLIYAIRGGK